MKKATLFFSAFTFLLGSANAQDYVINKHVANYEFEQSITIDGDYWDDPFWNGSVRPPRVEASGNIVIPTTDNTFDFAATYDDNYLYVAVIVKETYDQNLSWFRDDSDPSTPWEDDAIEIFIDPKNGHPLFQAIFNHKGNTTPSAIWTNGNYSKDGILFKTAFETGTMYISQYQLEVAIPWSKLGITPHSGLQFGFDIAVDDDDNGGARDGQIAWKGTANDWNSTANYGVVKLNAANYGIPYINYNTGSPVVDGEVIHDAAYTYSPADNVQKQVINTSDNQVTTRMTWDNNYLYVGVLVWDNHGYTNTLYNDSPEIWNDDAVEIFIDPLNTKLPYFDENLHRQILVKYSTSGVPPQVSVRGNSNGIIAASQIVNSAIYIGGYSVEVAIPWSNLGISPQVGMYMGFEVAVDDDDDGGTRDSQLAWQGTINDFQNASVWGTVLLNYNGFSTQTSGSRVGISMDAAAITSDYAKATSCFPNPMKDQLNIQFGQAASTIKILDAQGRVIAEKNVEGMTDYMLSTSEFEAGLYMITVYDVSGKIETFKVVK